MALSWIQDAMAVASGGTVGFSLGLIGGGGSILAVPLLLYVVGIGDAHVAIGTSALAVSLNAFGNLIGQWRAGNVKWPCAATPKGAPNILTDRGADRRADNAGGGEATLETHLADGHSCRIAARCSSEGHLRLFWNVVSLYRTPFDTLGPFCETENAGLHRVKRTAILLAPGMPNTGIRSRSRKRASDLHEVTLEPLWNLSPRPFKLAGASGRKTTGFSSRLIGGRTRTSNLGPAD
jgi:hypothetical protein